MQLIPQRQAFLVRRLQPLSRIMARYIGARTNHLLSISLTLITTIFLFLIILLNVPLPFNSTPSASNASGRFWLVRLTNDGMEYGFGIWGWCQWPSSDLMAISVLGHGDTRGLCRLDTFWKIPDSAELGDSILDVRLPT
jgi:hypothetical protein